MSRQTSIVQTALSEQMHAARNEYVIESVRLPALLAQALEVVPDAARKLLLIEADKSLTKVGRGESRPHRVAVWSYRI